MQSCTRRTLYFDAKLTYPLRQKSASFAPNRHACPSHQNNPMFDPYLAPWKPSRFILRRLLVRNLAVWVHQPLRISFRRKAYVFTLRRYLAVKRPSHILNPDSGINYPLDIYFFNPETKWPSHEDLRFWSLLRVFRIIQSCNLEFQECMVSKTKIGFLRPLAVRVVQ